MEIANPIRTKRRADFLVFAIVFAISLGFAVYTRHAWEDYYITYRCSKNLATGQGLVFTPGEKVHAFTSPLNVLIPAASSLATGNASDAVALWLFRLISCGALGGAGVLLYRITQAQGFRPLAAFTLLGLFATECKIVDFTINGQETGLMMLFLALMLHALLAPGGRPALRLTIAWTGLAWTRPDAVVYIAAIGGAFFLFGAAAIGNRSRIALLKTYLVAGAIAAVLYLPWVLWAWSYFGSPVPNTVVAKGLRFSLALPEVWTRTVPFLQKVVTGNVHVFDLLFTPSYVDLGGWPEWTLPCSRIAAWVAAFYWVLPFGRRETRAASLAFLVGVWYLSTCMGFAFPWYMPNIAVLAMYVLARIIDEVGLILGMLDDRAPAQPLRQAKRLHAAVAIGLPAATTVLLLCCAVQLRVQQREIETGNRKQIGLWLRDNAKTPNDSVFLEPLGYIGYFSQLKMHDWPGLCSREVVAARKKLNSDSWAKVIAEIRPDWLVLRPWEEGTIRGDDPGLLRDRYRVAKVFDVAERLAARHWLPGRGYLVWDQRFTVYARCPDKP